VAQTIAAAGMEAWADVLQAMPLAWTYQASHNARIPVFFFRRKQHDCRDL
jgi:hypothetical protein